MKTIKNPIIVALLSSSLGIASLAGAAKAPKPIKAEKSYAAQKGSFKKPEKAYKAQAGKGFKAKGFKAARSSW